MNLRVQSSYDGVEVEGETGDSPGQSHAIVDAETNLQVVDQEFSTAVEATLYLAAMRPELEARGLPAMSAAEEEEVIAECGKWVDVLEKAQTGKRIFAGNVPAQLLRWVRQPHGSRVEASVGDKLRHLAELLERHGSQAGG